MRHAILIHAHRFPEQFGRLCSAIRHPDFDIYANIDAKSDIETFRREAPTVQFVSKRTNIKWGHWSQVKATLDSLKEIVGSGKDYGYVLFISGQDYPICPLDEIAETLRQRYGQEFIGSSSCVITDRKQYRRLEMRYTKRWVHFKNKYLAILPNMVLRLLPDQKQYYPLYKGSQWWNLTLECVRYIIAFCEANPHIVQSYRHSLCPDEIFFQSMLHASPFKERLVNHIFRYIDWSDGPTSPKTLDSSDYEAIVNSGAWFARKVDMQKDSRLLDMLDKNIASKPSKPKIFNQPICR